MEDINIRIKKNTNHILSSGKALKATTQYEAKFSFFHVCIAVLIILIIFTSFLLGAYGFPPRGKVPAEPIASSQYRLTQGISLASTSLFNHTIPFLYPWGNVTCDAILTNNLHCLMPSGSGLNAQGNLPKKFSSIAVLASSDQFNNPKSNSSLIFVSDIKNNIIEKYYANGTFISQWGSKGTSPGQFYRPTALAVDNDTVYVGDSTGRIQAFDTNGTFKSEWGSLGQFDRQFLNISSISVFHKPLSERNITTQTSPNLLGVEITPTNSSTSVKPELGTPTIFVADTDNGRIQEFYTNGTLIQKFGSYGNLDGEFRSPNSIAIDPNSSRIYVSDSGNSRIQVFYPNGTFAFKWNLTNENITSFNRHMINPTGILVIFDRLLVADSGNNMILEYLLNGTFVNYWNLTNTFPSGLNLKNLGTLSISATKSKIGFIAIGFGRANTLGVFLYPQGANAGSDIITQPGKSISLDGSNSSATNSTSKILNYDWRLVSLFPTGYLPKFESHGKIAQFTVPSFLNNANLTFELNTLDSAGYNSSDYTNVYVSQPTNLSANAQLTGLGPIQEPLPGIPNTTPQYDKFGVLKIYQTKAGGEDWIMNMDNPDTDKRFDPQDEITRNIDGSWKMRSSQVRMGVFPSTGYTPQAITTTNELDLEKKGYMQGLNDWKNIEMTGYVKFNEGKEDNFAWYARGGRHTGSGPMEGCEGVAYKGDLFFSGKTQIAKEQWHVSYDYSPAKQAIEPIKGKWVGFKFIIYNTVSPNGKPAVKMENWVDRNNDQRWEKIYEYIDAGGWGRDAIKCGGTPDQIISWGGPIATFRWDSTTDVDFKFLSVREIDPRTAASAIPLSGQNFNGSYQENPPPMGSGGGNMGNQQDQNQNQGNTNSQTAVYNNYIHIVWEEPEGKNLQIFYKKSSDGGKTYDNPIEISNSSEDAFDSKIKIWKDKKIVVIYREGNDIFCTISSDNGETFSVPKNVSKSPQTISSDANIEIVDDSKIKIVWIEQSAKNSTSNPADFNISSSLNEKLPESSSSVVLAESTDGGSSFGLPRVISEDKNLEIHTPEIATTSDGKVYLCYVKGIEDNTDIYCNHSNNTGITFSNSTNVTNDPSSPSLTPSLSAANNTVYLAWSDLKNGVGGNLDVFSMAAKGDNGTFGNLTNLSNDTAGSIDPALSASGQNVHAAWGENTPGDNSIITRSSNDSGSSFNSKVFIQNNNSLFSHPDISSSGNDVIIVASVQNKSADENIKISKSNNGGQSFENETILTVRDLGPYASKIGVSLKGPTKAMPGQELIYHTSTSSLFGSLSYNYGVLGPQKVNFSASDIAQIHSLKIEMPETCLSDKDENYLVNVGVSNETGIRQNTSAKLLLLCKAGGIILKSSTDKANVGENVTISGAITGLAKDQQRFFDIYPQNPKINITEKSRCTDIGKSSCDPPYSVFTISECPELASNNTQIIFEGVLTDANNTKYTNSTSISVLCAGPEPSGNITKINNPPSANDSSFTTTIGNPVTVDLKLITADKDRNALSARIINKPSYGDIDDSKINSDGIIIYRPHDPSNSSSGPALPSGGEDSFQYDVFDGNQYSDKATIKINILQSAPASQSPESNPINNPPVAYDFSVPLESDQPIRINLLGHAVDKDGDSLVASIRDQPQFSQIPMVIENDNVSTYYQQSLSDNSAGMKQDSFTYQVSDGKTTSNIAKITISPQPKIGPKVPEGQVSNESNELPTQEFPSTLPESPSHPNKPPVANDVAGDTMPEKSVDIILSATDEDSNNLTAKIVKEPECGSVDINQQTGSLRYTANSASSISTSNCTEIKTGEWVDAFTYRVFDGQLESNIANVKVNIKLNEPGSKTVKDENPNDSNSPKIRLEGPNSASPGENVTLLASLAGIDKNQLTRVNFKQIEGQNVSYSECTINELTCTYPSISFTMPNCSESSGDVEFDLLVVENNQNQHNDKHTVKLNCPSGSNSDERQNQKSSDNNKQN